MLLDLSVNQIAEISSHINKLNHLQYLNLARNRLKSLPPNLKLNSLKKLNLEGNSFTTTDGLKSISNLESLMILNLGYNQISDIDGLNSSSLQELIAESCRKSFDSSKNIL